MILLEDDKAFSRVQRALRHPREVARRLGPGAQRIIEQVDDSHERGHDRAELAGRPQGAAARRRRARVPAPSGYVPRAVVDPPVARD
jgi:hypothetical protein